MKRAFIVLFFLMSLFFKAHSEDIKRPNIYNVQRAIEALNNNNKEEALEYIDKELSSNPKSGYAKTWKALIQTDNQEYSYALTTIDEAIKYLPKKDNEYLALAYGIKGMIYTNIEEYDKAISVYEKAIEKCPNDINLYEKRAELYYRLGDYDLSDKDYDKIIKLDEGYITAYMGIGRNKSEQGLYDDAIKTFDYVIKLANDYSSAYSFRAECQIKKHNDNLAIDDILKALSIDGDDKAFYLMVELAQKNNSELLTKLKIKQVKEPNEPYWPYCIGVVYENLEKYDQAIIYYSKSLEIERDPIIYNRLSECYYSLGNFTKSLELIDNALETDSLNNNYLFTKSDILYELGKVDRAIKTMDLYITNDPEFYGGYYRRGFYKQNIKDYTGAIEDYTTSIILNPNNAYSYIGRADMYRQTGDKEKYLSDCRKIIEIDTIPQINSCAQFAFLELGEIEKAKEFMNKIIELDTNNEGAYYDAACLYSRIGDKDKALLNLRLCLEKGFRRFYHIELDDDLDFIRNEKEFKELIDKYKNEVKNKSQIEIAYKQKNIEIPFIKDGNVLSVKCKINNLPLYFIFDTGATDISLSDVEAAFMIKNNYISEKDIIGRQQYLTADGSIIEGTVINLKKIELGELELNNIKASVVKNQKAPLLLGQSVFNKMGKFEIDNEKMKIKITYNVKQNE
jgi:clan AA aspartic protease (TIGR02281 family)